MNNIQSPRTDDAGLEPMLAAAAVAPRVKLSDLDDAIVRDEYIRVEGTTLTICVLHLRNGFTVTGESAAASLENFDANVGRSLALAKARDKLWPLLGYALKELLYGASVAGALYQFMGDLTSRDVPITLGATHDAAPAADAVREFLRANGIRDEVEPAMHWRVPQAPASDYRERVRSEQRDVNARLAKLEGFIDSARFEELPADERVRMRRQAHAMREYSTVLQERIGAFS